MRLFIFVNIRAIINIKRYRNMSVMEDVFCFRAKRNGRNCILYIAYMKILQYTYYIQNWCWCEKAYRCWINSLLKLRLFILLNGECPMCPMEPDILITDAIRYNHNARYSFMTIDDFIDMGLRSSDEKKYYIENLCVAFSLLQWWVRAIYLDVEDMETGEHIFWK